MSRRTAVEMGHVWLAIGLLAWIILCWLLGERFPFPGLALASTAFLPAVLSHLALVFPTPTSLVRSYPAALSVPYMACAVPAAVGARAAESIPGAGHVVIAITLGLGATTGAALVYRLLRNAAAPVDEEVTLAARIALTGVSVALVAFLVTTWRPTAVYAVAAFPVALAVAGGRLTQTARARSAAAAEALAAGAITLEHLAPGLAHAMRKPLAAVASQIRELMEDTLDEAPRRRLAESAELLDQLQQLVGDVLSLARGQAAPSRRQLSLRSIGEQALRDVRARFPSAEIETELGAGYLMADEVSIRFVLVNLLENALEAAENGGWVRLRAVHEEDLVRIDVEDRSGGLPKEVRARLFQPFLSTKTSGIGLGLATVREICHAHDGDVQVESTPAGTRFVITLPAEAG